MRRVHGPAEAMIVWVEDSTRQLVGAVDHPVVTLRPLFSRENSMKIFISWSGQRGKLVAEPLRSWLPDVLHRSEPWVSVEDIDPGARWNNALARQLEDAQFGIVCLTAESASAPWVLFEAGALAKTLGSSRVCPYLIQMSPRDLKPPLAQFEAVEANKSGTLKLLRCINRALEAEGSLPDDRLLRAFDRWWPDLEQVLDGIPSVPPEPEHHFLTPTSLGVERVFESRSEALTYFVPSLVGEIDRSRRGNGLLYVTAHLDAWISRQSC